MAAYPSYTIGIASKQVPVDGYADDFSESGGLRSRAFHDDQYYQFTLFHPVLTGAEFESLLATYAADPKATHTLTYRGISYDVVFTSPPVITSNLGASKYHVRAELYGPKT